MSNVIAAYFIEWETAMSMVLTSEQRVKLYDVLMSSFDRSDLTLLCFYMNIDSDIFSGGSKNRFTLELIQYCERQGVLETLIDKIRHDRPRSDLSFLPQRQLPVEVVAEAKLVLVGDGNVGKTSLVNRLVYGTFNDPENTTRGVAITHWMLPLSCLDAQNARMNIWDFGGQGNMHATHPYFFSHSAIYLIVLNLREDERVNRAEYWLRLIRTHGGESPIIIVANKVDQFVTRLDERTLKDKYPQIVSFVRTSCKDNIGIPELRAEISKAACLLEDIAVSTPSSLVRVKQVLEEMTDPRGVRIKDTLSLDEYEALCEENRVEPDQRALFLRRLSNLGVMLYFGDDPRLDLSVVLNPFWVTEGVYRIINHEPLALAGGKLEIGHIRNILPRQRYALDEGMYILNIMQKFELCFALDERQTLYLLPDLLPPQQPELPAFDREQALKFQYEYSVWQAATLTRLLVRLHNYLASDTYWRNGALLESSDKKNRALVIADEADRRLRVWVDGAIPSRREFLNRIRDELNVIHGIQRDEFVKEWVIVPNGGEVPYQFLKDLEEKGQVTCYIPVGYEAIELNVKECLDGVRAEVINPSRILELLVERMSLDELDALCFKFKISLEDVEGPMTRDAKARNIIRLFERTRRMPELMAVLRDLRPGMSWE